MTVTLGLKDLQRELRELNDEYPRLADDELFVLWFLRAFVIEDEKTAAAALCGGSRDKSIDAVVLDERAKTAFVIQGKCRRDLNAKHERRGDLMGFAQLTSEISATEAEAIEAFGKGLAPDVLMRLTQARERVRERGYHLQLYYITLGKVAPALMRQNRLRDACL